MKYRLYIFTIIFLGIACNKEFDNSIDSQTLPSDVDLSIIAAGNFGNDSILIRLDHKIIAKQKVSYDPVWSVCWAGGVRVFKGIHTINCTSFEKNISGQFSFTINETSTIRIRRDTVISFEFLPGSPQLE